MDNEVKHKTIPSRDSKSTKTN